MSTRHRSSGNGRRKKKKSQNNNSGMLIGFLVGGGIVAVVAIVAVAFIVGRQSGQSQGDQAVAESALSSQPVLMQRTSESVDENSSSSDTLPEDPHAAMDLVNETAVDASVDLADPTAIAGAELSISGIKKKANNSRDQRPSEPYQLPALIELVESSVVRILVKSQFGGSLGSGFVVGEEGVIVTNYHVLEGATSAEVQFNDGRKEPVAGIFKVDHERDLIVFKINVPQGGVKSLSVADSLPAKGINVATFGAPRGLSFTTSEGIVSGLRNAKEVGHAAGNYVQTTAAISGGNSGGPLVNMYGEVIGVNTFKRTDGESLNFAVSCLDIRDMVEKKGNKLVSLSPENVPVKISSGYGGAENLVGTERGRLLLSQIREAMINMVPFNSDPSGRITGYVLKQAEKTFEQRLKWKNVRRRSEVNQSTAFVIVAMYFSLTEGQERSLVSDLNIHVVILARDVDKEGNELTAKVWDEKKAVGKVTLKALANGIVSRTLGSGITAYFSDLTSAYRKALREIEAT